MAQIGEIRIQTQNNGIITIPVFEIGDSGNGVYEFLRVETGTGTGFLPLAAEADATYRYVRFQSQNNGLLAFHDNTSTQQPIQTTSTLNADSVTLTVYEDTGSSVLSEEFTVTGGSETFVPSTLNLNSGNDVWFRLEATDDTDITTAMTEFDVTINAT